MATRAEIEAARKAAGETIPEHDRGPYRVPVQDPRDAFLRPAPTLRDESILDLANPSGVFTPGQEPGPSEFSHGRGLMAPPGMQPPSGLDEMKAVMRTNPADPGATADYEVTDHSHSADGRYIARVREAEQDLGEL